MKTYSNTLISTLLLVTLLIESCASQVQKSPIDDSDYSSRPSPKIIGTPPPPNPVHNPYNDTGLVSQYIRSMYEDSKGNFWCGPAGESVARYDGKVLEYYSQVDFFEGNDSEDLEDVNSVHAIAEDTRGHIWFGTDHGAVKYDGKAFRSYTEKDGLSNINISRQCILVDQSGTVWVGTQGGVFRYSPSADSTNGQGFSLFDLLPSIQVKAIMEDNNGDIWFASQVNGVFRYDGTTVKNMSIEIGLGGMYAGGMVQDHQGNIWFTIHNGIGRYDGNTVTEFTTIDGLDASEVWGIYKETSGIIWITARGSTTRFDPTTPLPNPKAFTRYTIEDGLNCCVQSMYQDRSGNMWWGTGQGLYRFDGKRFYQVRQYGPW